MNDIFWLRRGVLAGSSGPNRVPWQLKDFAEHNVQRVLSVNNGEMIRAKDLFDRGVEYACFPLSDSAPPVEGDVDLCITLLPAALEFALSPLPNDGATLVHCSSGKDRTGLFMSYYLCVVEGYAPQESIDEVRRVRPIALSAAGWEKFAIDVLGQVVEQHHSATDDQAS